MPFNLTRSVLVILVPGGTALVPFILLLTTFDDRAKDFVRQFPSLAAGITFAGVVVTGTIIQLLASYMEDRFDRQIQSKDEFDVCTDWYDYLALQSSTLVGYDFIGRLAVSLQFQLAMVVAVLTDTIGLAFWTQRHALGYEWKMYHWVFTVENRSNCLRNI